METVPLLSFLRHSFKHADKKTAFIFGDGRCSNFQGKLMYRTI